MNQSENDTITKEIKAFFKGDIQYDQKTLETYSYDASLFKVTPEIVVFPKDVEDIKKLVTWVKDSKHKYPNLSLTARAAGTCMSGGSLNTSIILDTTKYLDKIISVERSGDKKIIPVFPGGEEVVIVGHAIVEPGCFYRDFEKETLKKDLLLPCYTASKSINAMGGMVGNNSAGELTLRYGKTEDYVSELSIILSDGNEYTVKPLSRKELEQKIAGVGFEADLYKSLAKLIDNNKEIIHNSKPQVSKNSAGYTIWNVWNRARGEQEEVFDLPKLIVGSQGTLGIVTRVTIDLIENPKTSKLLVVFLNKLDTLGDIVKELVAEKPQSIESYDDKTFGLAVKFFFDFLKTKGLWGFLKMSMSFIPEFFMMLTGGVPKLILLVEFAGATEEETQRACEKARLRIKHFKLNTRITKSQIEADKYWSIRRDSFALLRKHVRGRRTAPFIDDIVVKPEFLPEFLPKLNSLLAEYPYMVYTIAGHAGNGNFHIIPLMDMNDPKTIPTIFALSEKVYDLVALYKGSITAEHNDGIIRTPFLSKMYSKEMIDIFVQIKNIFDPLNIFNPGKKVGAKARDMEKYIIKGDHQALAQSHAS